VPADWREATRPRQRVSARLGYSRPSGLCMRVRQLGSRTPVTGCIGGDTVSHGRSAHRENDPSESEQASGYSIAKGDMDAEAVSLSDDWRDLIATEIVCGRGGCVRWFGRERKVECIVDRSRRLLTLEGRTWRGHDKHLRGHIAVAAAELNLPRRLLRDSLAVWRRRRGWNALQVNLEEVAQRAQTELGVVRFALRDAVSRSAKGEDVERIRAAEQEIARDFDVLRSFLSSDDSDLWRARRQRGSSARRAQGVRGRQIWLRSWW
jgi:hypothetical protein